LSFLDDLESNLKNLESREERGDRGARERKLRDIERARTQASAAYADQLKKGPYTGELLKQVARLGHAARIKPEIKWVGPALRLEARGHRLELRPTPQGVVAVFAEHGSVSRTAPIDLTGRAESLAREWLSSLPPLPAPPTDPELDLE